MSVKENILSKPTLETGADEDQLLKVSLGPQHPSTHGVFRMNVMLDGETVVRATPVVGYLHTGIEKTHLFLVLSDLILCLKNLY